MTTAAALAWTGVLLQLYLSLTRSTGEGQSLGEGLIQFLGYFTILTNLCVCAALTVPLLASASAVGRFLTGPLAVGGIAVSIAFVALAYHVLLRHLWNPQGLHLLADSLLHYAVPALFVLYWLVIARNGSLRWVHPFLWSAYPVTYFVYALVRGEIIGSYPYGFIDVAAIGYARSLANAAWLLVVFLVIGMAFVAVDRVAGRTLIRGTHGDS